MHTIRVYGNKGGLITTFKGVDAERQLRLKGWHIQEEKGNVLILR